MPNVLLSIITIVKNNKEGLRRTFDSVFSQTSRNFEYIVIDGDSNDGSKELIVYNSGNINLWISEKDGGIYDAMNKGIALASGTYILFMNSGDCLNDEYVIENLESTMNSLQYDCIFSDTIFSGRNMLYIFGSKKKRRVIHQSFVYKKGLHESFGFYINSKNVTISDYFFFNLIYHTEWYKVNFVIARCDATGISQNNFHYYQKLGVDLIFGNRPRGFIALMLIFYPVYKVFRKFTYFLNFKVKK